MGTQSLSLKWNSHQRNLVDVFEQLLWNEDLVDVTLACEGITLKAHKTLLSACSPFFHSLFLEHPCKHPVIIMKDIKYRDLKSIIEFMYRGEIIMPQERLTDFLKTAEVLQVKGLTENSNSHSDEAAHENIPSPTHISSQASYTEEHLDSNFSSQKKRKRFRAGRKRSSSDLSDDEHQSNNKDAKYCTATDSSNFHVECNSADISQERITAPSNVRENTVCLTAQQLSTTFNGTLINSGSDIEISNNLDSQLRKDCVQIIQSAELVLPETEQCTSNSVSIHLPPMTVHAPDTGTIGSRSVVQEPRKGVKPASPFTYSELPVTYEAEPSTEKSTPCIKIESSNRYAECEQSTKEAFSAEPLQSSPSMASYLLKMDPCETGSNNAIDSQSCILPSSSEQECDDQAITILNMQSQTQEVPENDGIQREYKKLKHTKLVCKFCNKHFPYYSYLKRHLTTHSEQRPFSCKQCGKRFKRLSHAKSHSQTHLRNSYL